MSDLTSRYPYYQIREFTTSLAGQEMTVCTKPGLPNWNQVSNASRLAAEKIRLESAGQVVLMGAGHGALAVSTAGRIGSGRLHILDENAISLRLTQKTLERNQIQNAEVHSEISLLPGMEASFDAAVMELPKGRKLARRWMVEVLHLLRPEGKFILCGPNDQGIQAVIKDAAALFHCEPAILGYKKGSRAAQLVKTGSSASLPDWALEPGISPGTWSETRIEAGGRSYQMRTLPGVFSYDALDEGTHLLLESLPATQGKRALDFGCGSGIIGIHLARGGASSVDLIDASLLAVASATENLRLNGVHSAKAFPSDVLEAVSTNTYGLIASNPPFHAGKDVDYEITRTFIQHTYDLLEVKGLLIVVANRFIRYDKLMLEKFESVEVLAQTGKFHVLAGSK